MNRLGKEYIFRRPKIMYYSMTVELELELNYLHMGALSVHFETEMVDLESLKEILHDDLRSIGAKTFGQKQKILKELRKFSSHKNGTFFLNFS